MLGAATVEEEAATRGRDAGTGYLRCWNWCLVLLAPARNFASTGDVDLFFAGTMCLFCWDWLEFLLRSRDSEPLLFC